MGESDIALHDDEAVNFELPDRCLRASGEQKLGGPACSFTLAFCSGIDTCPSSIPR
jgi:hypothetical protein